MFSTQDHIWCSNLPSACITNTICRRDSVFLTCVKSKWFEFKLKSEWNLIVAPRECYLDNRLLKVIVLINDYLTGFLDLTEKKKLPNNMIFNDIFLKNMNK